MDATPKICLTPGCPNGIGPEVLTKALLNWPASQHAQFLFAGTPNLLATAAQRAGCDFENNQFSKEGQVSPTITCLFENHELPPVPKLGELNEDSLIIQARAIEKAVTLAKENKIHGMVTGPIRKSALKYLDDAFVGHTEYLHSQLAQDGHPPLMAFVGGPFVLGLATIHTPLNCVASQLSVVGLQNHLLRLFELTKTIKRTDTVTLAVLGLNPHAGEDGLLGHEEKEIIQPAIESLQKEGLVLQGPFSADGFFARYGKPGAYPQVDGVLAMYHDQGLAPYKILARGKGVNITSGLSIVRTSPDHGTADDIAGLNQANADAMQAAIETCLSLIDL